MNDVQLVMVGAPVAVFVVASAPFSLVSADVALGVLLSNAAVQNCRPLVLFLQHHLRPLVHPGVSSLGTKRGDIGIP